MAEPALRVRLPGASRGRRESVGIFDAPLGVRTLIAAVEGSEYGLPQLLEDAHKGNSTPV